MPDARIAAIRRFNRLVTQRVGALEDHFLGRDRPLGHSRVLYEIGRNGADLRDLRATLGLDSGYLTRIVQALAVEGLVTVEPDPDDERVRHVRLTSAGSAEIDEMDRRSDESAADILEPLTEKQRDRLVSAMEDVRRLLLASAVRIEMVDPDSEEALRCLERFYAEVNQRFESGFDLGHSLPAPAADFVPPTGAFLVASGEGRSVGCGAVRRLSTRIGSIRRMWVAEEVRGLGIGRRILAALEDEAARLGFTRVRLETNRALREAISLYRTSGYREVAPFNDEPYAHHWFEKRLERRKRKQQR
jgi:DNA-binding MarR family transcriptional regulator